MASGVHTSLLSAGYQVSTAGVTCVWAALLGWKKVCFGWIHGRRVILSRGSVAGTHGESPDHSRVSRRTLSRSNVIDLFRVVVARSCRNSSSPTDEPCHTCLATLSRDRPRVRPGGDCPHPSRRRRAPNGTICGISVVELKSRNGNGASRNKQEHSGFGIRPDWDTENPL